MVRAGPELASYRGATVVLRPPACVLAVPADWYAPVASRLGRLPPAEAFDATLLRQVFGAAAANCPALTGRPVALSSM